MKKICLFAYLLIWIIPMVSAQDKLLSLEDLTPGGTTYGNFSPKTELNYKWYGNELAVYDDSLMSIINPANNKVRLTLSNKELQNITGLNNSSLRSLSFISIEGKHLASISIRGKRLFFDLETKKVELEIQQESNWANIDFSKENLSIAFTQKEGLYIKSANSEPFVVAESEKPGIVYGQSVHRDEFGIYKGTFWSPKGNFLAFYRMDESMVTEYPLVHIPSPQAPFGSKPREAELKPIRYPMAGQTSHEVTIGIYHLQSGQTVYLKTGEPKDHYLTNIAWDPSEKFIYVAEINREQNHMKMNKYDVESGLLITTLFEESNEHYVEPSNPPLFLKTNPDMFIWQSQRDGYNHLYLYNTNGDLVRQLTSGNYPVAEVIGLDEKNQYVYISTNEQTPIDFHTYKVEIKTGKKTLLTPSPGVHRSSLNMSGNYLLNRYSNQNVPLCIDLVNTKNGKTNNLQLASNPYAGYKLPEITLGNIKAADGKSDLYYRLVKPTDFDPNKKYPTVIYVYGGPHSQMVRNTWMGGVRGWDVYMAQQGYVVFTLDNRGTSNRGFDFESVIHRRLGYHEVEDQMKGVDFLLSLPYVDADRMGVYGWSFGGFMATSLMLRYGDLFKVGVAGGAVIDWSYYEVMYGERYMDSPQENQEGYEYSNLNNLAGNLSGRLLLIHGDEDPTVVMQHTLSFLKACISARTYPDYFIYTGHGHNMGGKDRVHLQEKITRYFNDYLKK
ncbi:DPP IV N-terminal domain-containing protein [Bacteroidales bacterium OttesenSCG-928-M11]|nr:DPP IV N-terminal domain-containing protein [Bacteroidales bacterium OttesenSCG-928-M11]